MDTHVPLLAACVAKTTGPVLELGCGHFSTPLLSEMCKLMDRQLISVETDQEWIKQVQPKTAFQIQFLKLTDDFDKTGHTINDIDSPDMKIWRDHLYGLTDHIGMFGLVFVDNRPGESRKFIMNWMRNCADVLVLHDTENLVGFETEPILKTFPHRYTFKSVGAPWTDAVSMEALPFNH